ncbi:phage gp6-like head-tail connector protein [Listeria booriae]|uniref:Phage gp6-like head-tail connector protein n=1 Tax=Listeria booriae TaxID=1552123 RepID=A0A842AMY8_9LIST|nr:head-tail connector protein [Listeria booriae]MBC1402138.1 phage gp6-like head-tail connector protein [Listeria booriae]MBC1617870.1 phage gp6-like head-tail connector protein [Listeria booriae]
MKIEMIKNHLKVEHDFDDDLISQIYLPTAQSEIKGAVSFQDDESFFENRSTFNMAVLLLVGHYYENRKATSLNNMNEIPFGVDSLIQRLRGEHSKWNLDNSTPE